MVRGPIGWLGILLLGFGFYILEGGSTPPDLPMAIATHPSIAIVLGFYCFGTDVVRQVRKDLKSFRGDLRSELKSATERIDALLAHAARPGDRAATAPVIDHETEATMEQIKAAMKSYETRAA